MAPLAHGFAGLFFACCSFLSNADLTFLPDDDAGVSLLSYCKWISTGVDTVKAASWKTCLAGSALLMMWGCSTSIATTSTPTRAAPQLFTLEQTQDRQALQRTATGQLATLLADPANAEITLVKVDPQLVSQQNKELAVSLPDGKTAQFRLRDYTAITSGIVGWVGYLSSTWKQAHGGSSSEIDNDPLFYLSLARAGDTLVGDLTIDGQPYRLQPLDSGQHVLIRIDESKLAPEAEPLLPLGTAAPDPTIGKAAQSAHSTIRVLFMATDQRKLRNPEYKIELALALNNANQYMKNSNVPITYQLAGYYEGPYDETGRSYKEQLNDMRLAQPFAQQLLAIREALRADLVSMYSTATEYCGMAWLTTGKLQGHSVISCSSSLAHELGHNLGANHNWEPGNAIGNPPYMFGYRYTAGTPRFSTQMSYGCSPACPRIAYHSNPRLTYQGIPLGTTQNHDVARRFNERRDTVANFYPSSLETGSALINKKRLEEGKAACATVNQYREVQLNTCPATSDEAELEFRWKALAKRTSYSIGYKADGAECLGQPLVNGGYRLRACPALGAPGRDISWLLKPQGSDGMMLEDLNDKGQCLASRSRDNVVVKQPCDSLDAAQRWLWPAAIEALSQANPAYTEH
ncbi:zinc-dependent metalloprotease family protein [Pseudomonas sp. p106]|uniref:zinc-dependent metalloprotease family protein n=1 Tax=Pseudomonas sp. p106 TaxID=2479854 RepID=UPI00131573D7|nr:zinc-dependent metalloprotease family protein [Pseudomonas sp. p106]